MANPEKPPLDTSRGGFAKGFDLCGVPDKMNLNRVDIHHFAVLDLNAAYAEIPPSAGPFLEIARAPAASERRDKNDVDAEPHFVY